jgi:hypothetical protein
MYRRLAAGEFGNTMQVFDGLDQALSSGISPLGVRCLNPGDPLKIYWCPRENLLSELRKHGAEFRHDLVFYSTDYGLERDRIVQGELCRSSNGINFFYSLAHLPMRVALEQSGVHLSGLNAQRTLQWYVQRSDPSGYDWLMSLLDLYPDHVIEFTTYRKPIGTHPARTLIWEVRLY